ncbi:MAG: hypothetical protein A3F83_15240 [Candidatus Glassbacteria bacterium RIFCSPLOWO2_12_FULL_58_11]|uniref:histidine kinase n=1 Tax=Candidatus Glassbacteria bacterium RIFCSPLOWO2_12_FULL_58_11 TaxID=1817867 RepID=A0A1F5YQ96_9BACT|nr:MAG: hypothetical protein A3F83_15240 [Candidatus Glassbacteria bacterium RIFCSPLOWO2_12_FULL_58_11]
MDNIKKNPFGFAALALIFVALLLPAVGYLSYRNNLANLEQMLYSEGSALVEAILHESENSLLVEREIRAVLGQRLEDNCRHILLLDRNGLLEPEVLASTARAAGLSRLDLYASSGELKASSDPGLAPARAPRFSQDIEPEEDVTAAFVSGPADEAGDSLATEYFTIAVSGSDSALAVAYIESGKLAQLRHRLGIGLILEDLSAVEGVAYAVLQDTLGIIAASYQVASLPSIAGDPFFQFSRGQIKGRYTDFQGAEVYELAASFQFEGENYGYLRIGLSTEEIRSIAATERRRVALAILVLAVLLSVVIALYFAGRRQLTLELEHARIQSFSRSVLDGMAEAVIVLDDQQRIVLVNQACKALCGLSGENLMGETLARANPALAQALAGLAGSPRRAMETRLSLPGSEESVPVMLYATPLEASGRRYTTVILGDLTDREQAEKLALHNEKYKTMAEVSAGVAHEIRNPLNAIGMNVQRLKLEFSPAGRDAGEYAQFIDTILSEVDRLNRIVEQFLGLARFPEPRLEPGRLDSLLEETLAFLEPELAGRGIKVLRSLEPSPACLFDPGQIRQVATNLAANAAEAMDGPGTLTVKGRTEEGEYRIEMSDTGPGIAENIQQKIFEPFFSTKSHGMGLGLAIVSRIVTEHGGNVAVQNEPGRGARFTVRLPLRPAA